MGLLDDIATVALESHDPTWIVRVIESCLREHKVKDFRVAGASMATELRIVIHTKRYAVTRPRVSGVHPAWDPDTESWDEYKETAVRSIWMQIVPWLEEEGAL